MGVYLKINHIAAITYLRLGIKLQLRHMPHPMAREVNCLICNFMDINENLKNKVKTVNRKNTINILISDKSSIKPPWLHVFMFLYHQ